jgi:ribosome maturation factor RimP
MDITKNRLGVEKKFWELCVPVVQEQGLALYDLEFLPGQKLLRLYIMNPETKSAVIEDCVKVDHALTPFFESETWMPAEVTLEVGSPGVYRHVNSLAHFQLGLGETHAVTIMGSLDPVANPGAPKKVLAAKKFRGELLEVRPDAIVIETDDGNVTLAFASIKNAQVDPDFEDIMKNAKNNSPEEAE